MKWDAKCGVHNSAEMLVVLAHYFNMLKLNPKASRSGLTKRNCSSCSACPVISLLILTKTWTLLIRFQESQLQYSKPVDKNILSDYNIFSYSILFLTLQSANQQVWLGNCHSITTQQYAHMHFPHTLCQLKVCGAGFRIRHDVIETVCYRSVLQPVLLNRYCFAHEMFRENVNRTNSEAFRQH